MLWILIPLFVVPIILLIFYFALSSCLGDSLRRGRIVRPSYGRTYLNSISSGAWENVEMDRIHRDDDSISDLDSDSENDRYM